LSALLCFSIAQLLAAILYRVRSVLFKSAQRLYSVLSCHARRREARTSSPGRVEQYTSSCIATRQLAQMRGRLVVLFLRPRDITRFWRLADEA